MNDILAQLIPEKEKQAQAQAVTQEIIAHLEQQEGVVECIAGGSCAKGTNLKNNFDIDIFVRYKPSVKDYSRNLEKALSPFQTERVRASRDYFMFTYKGHEIECIPVKYITSVSEAENSTDLSPLHVAWAKAHLSSEQANDVRKAKQFCRVAHVYGAESYRKGFSGHVLEILIIHHTTFDHFIQAVSEWTFPVHIGDASKKLNPSKTAGPLVVVDPIDPERNAAAAVSFQQAKQLQKQARAYLAQEEKEAFFVLQPFTLPEGNLHVVECTPLEGNKDIALTKVLKVYEWITRGLEEEGFSIRTQGWNPETPTTTMYWEVEEEKLPSTYYRQGPHIDQKEAVQSFKEKHQERAEQQGDYYVVLEKRKHPHIRDCLTHLINTSYTQERCIDIFIKED